MKLEEVVESITQYGIRVDSDESTEDGSVLVESPGDKQERESFWCNLFQKFFIEEDCHADDLLILVRREALIGRKDNVGALVQNDVLDIYRRGSTTRAMPRVGDETYHWEHTTCLNLLLQQVTYHMTCAICDRDSTTKRLKVIHRTINQVYPSPSRRSMEDKSADEIITFPFIYFSIDDFDQRFNDVVISPNQCVCVELVADMGTVRTTVFSGAVPHDQLAASFSSKTGRSRIGRRSKNASKMQFINMRGPKGIGHAEMAISLASPSSEEKAATSTTGSKTGMSGALRKLSVDTLSFVKDWTSGGPDVSMADLNAYLTFVSLSWETMIENLTKKIQKPYLDNRPREAT